MVKRGRKSTAELAVVQGSFGKRPEPPPELTDEQGAIWRAVAASEATDFFSTDALRALLADYCRHRDAAARVSKIIDEFQPSWLKSNEGAKQYDRLLKVRERETRASASLATKMRLTNQARYTPQAAATASKNTAKGYRPWEV